jgi:hypothetical protein
MTYPAPEILEDDPWFGPAPDTEKSIALKQLIQEQILHEEDFPKENQTKEPENIHEVLYDIATKNVATTLTLDPLPSFIGGSENYQEPWMSGVGPHF